MTGLITEALLWMSRIVCSSRNCLQGVQKCKKKYRCGNFNCCWTVGWTRLKLWLNTKQTDDAFNGQVIVEKSGVLPCYRTSWFTITFNGTESLLLLLLSLVQTGHSCKWRAGQPRFQRKSHAVHERLNVIPLHPMFKSIQHKVWSLFQKTKKKFGQDRVYHCVTSLLLFTTMTKHSGTEDKNCCKFWKWNSFPFLLDARLQLLNSPRSLLLYFFLLFHNGRQVWTAGKDSLVPALFYYESHAVVTRADCGLALSRWNKQERPWKSHCLSGWKRMLSQILHF